VLGLPFFFPSPPALSFFPSPPTFLARQVLPFSPQQVDLVRFFRPASLPFSRGIREHAGYSLVRSPEVILSDLFRVSFGSVLSGS